MHAQAGLPHPSQTDADTTWQKSIILINGVRLGPMRIVACARDIGCAHARSNCRCLAVPCVSIRMAVLDKGDPQPAEAAAMSLSDPASGRKSSLVSTWRARREQNHDAAHAIGTLW